MPEKPWVRTIPNTCGELEQEGKSRRFNVIEPFAVMTLLLVVLWLFAYPFGVLLEIKIVDTISHVVFAVSVLYILFVSPRINKDTLAQWGLGNPVALWRLVRDGGVGARVVLPTVVLTLIAILTTIGYIKWDEVADFFFDMNREAAFAMRATVGGKILITLFLLVLATFLTTCVLRYDNFLSAFLTALKIAALLGILMYGLALFQIGPKAFSDFQASKFALDVLGYVFWGALQQLLFSSYFGTRFRKGFAPSRDPAKRWRKRLWVSVLNGLFFGLIHINSWLLVGATWILGTFLSWVFMEDRNRNLIALGFVHGFLGSSIGWLFSSGQAGGMEVDMSVGPWNLGVFDLPTLLITVPLIAAFIVFMVYAYRKLSD